MMRDVDAMLDEALDAEERELLRSLDEPGFFGQAAGVFAGPSGWANIVMMAAQGALFIAGVWAAWQFFAAADTVTQLRWGLPAAVFLLMSLILKMALVPRMESNRLLLALKRVELQVAHLSRQ